MEEEELNSGERSSLEEGEDDEEMQPYVDLTMSPPVENLGRPSQASSPTGSEGPGLPWVLNGYANVHMQVRDERQQIYEPKYIRFSIDRGEPMVYATRGIGAPEYGQILYAEPYLAAAPELAPPEGDYREFAQDQYFNRGAIRGAELLGDFGILAEVYRLQRIADEERQVREEEDKLKKEDQVLVAKYWAVLSKRNLLRSKKAKIKERLAGARVRMRIQAHLDDGEDVEGALGSADALGNWFRERPTRGGGPLH